MSMQKKDWVIMISAVLGVAIIVAVVMNLQFKGEISSLKINLEKLSTQVSQNNDLLTKQNIASDTEKNTNETAPPVRKIAKVEGGVLYLDGEAAYTLINIPAEEFVEEAVKFSENFVYIAGRQSGLGGYILYGSGLRSLKRISLFTGEIKEILPRGNYEIYDISFDDQFVAYTDSAKQKVIVRNMSDDKEKTYTVDAKYGQFGDVYFSPDGKQLVYAAAIGDATKKESGAVYTVDLKSGEVKTYAQTDKPNTYFHVTGWSDSGIQNKVVTTTI